MSKISQWNSRAIKEQDALRLKIAPGRALQLGAEHDRRCPRIKDSLIGSKRKMRSFAARWWTSCSILERCAMVAILTEQAAIRTARDGLLSYRTKAHCASQARQSPLGGAFRSAGQVAALAHGRGALIGARCDARLRCRDHVFARIVWRNPGSVSATTPSRNCFASGSASLYAAARVGLSSGQCVRIMRISRWTSCWRSWSLSAFECVAVNSRRGIKCSSFRPV